MTKIKSGKSDQKGELLLKLASEKYLEEERRNDLIDRKNTSLVGFLGVMLSIQATLFPNLLNTKLHFNSFWYELVILVYFLSLLSYFIAMILFFKSLNYKKFESTPVLEDLYKFKTRDYYLNKIINTIINNYKNVIEKNDKIMCDKINYSTKGMYALIFGIIMLILFIILFTRGYIYV